MRYRELYRRWKNHDLKSEYRPTFYQQLPEREKDKVWTFIETRYLDNYTQLIKIQFEIFSTGMWQIPFPGSVAPSSMLHPEHYGIPRELVEELQEWNDFVDDNLEPWDGKGKPDWHKADAWGLSIAKKLKYSLGNGCYVEFHPFQELVIQGNEVVELPVPLEVSRYG